jgi:hypothetical protein
MAWYPVDGAVLYAVSNLDIWTKQGTSFLVGGSFTTVSGTPSQQLLPSTNTTVGYWNGQMLAYANGDGTGMYAGLTAGAQINWDVNSTDTGQAIWNGNIICDPALTQPFTINTTYLGTLQVATRNQNWVIRQQFLYGGGTPASDATAVAAAVARFGSASQTMNPSGNLETVFAY